jgi:hypothetical protein
MARFHHLVTGVLCALLTLAAADATHAHGLAENRATFVLRDHHHVSVTLFITFSEALRRELAPERSLQDFVLAYAALQPAVFEAVLRKAQNQFEAKTRAETADGHQLLFERWTWPDAATVQQALRERAMVLLVAPDDAAHERALEVRAEGHAAQPIASLRVHFPPAFQRVLAVSYQPQQVWVEPQGPSPAIKF